MGPLDNMCLNGDIQTVVNATNLNLSRLNQIQMQESFIYLGLGQVATRIFRVDEAITGSQATTVDHATAITVNSTRLADQEARISANEAAITLLSAGVTDLRSDMNTGIAMANAMEVFLPDPGARFRLNVGMGTHGGMAAIGITGADRINEKGDALYIGAAAVPGRSGISGKAGISLQW